jgi:DNA-binding transcriptional LysR family regulator
MTISLRQLQIISAVAGNSSLTRAAKQLGLSQPSLSQQLAKLEGDIGRLLFDRSSKPLRLTDAGRFLLEKAERVLATLDEAEVGLAEFAHGTRGRVAIGALSSLARGLLAPAAVALQRQHPNLLLRISELPADEALEHLRLRRVEVAVVSTPTLPQTRLPFARVELADDPYLLATPKGLNLAGVHDPMQELSPGEAALLQHVIGLDLDGVRQAHLLEWYDRFLPGYREVAQCRTFELALAMVEAGLGVAIVPMLATRLNGRPIFNVDLYELPVLPRRLVALLPTQYRHHQPYQAVVQILLEVGRSLSQAAPLELPPFAGARASDAEPLIQ